MKGDRKVRTIDHMIVPGGVIALEETSWTSALPTTGDIIVRSKYRVNVITDDHHEVIGITSYKQGIDLMGKLEEKYGDKT